MFDMKQTGNQRGAVKKTAASQQPVLRLRYLLMMALVGVIASGVWMLRSSVPDQVMAFEHVNIKGDFTNLSPEQVGDTVKANLDGDYFTLDLDAMRSALLQLPWVEEVSVRRRWPSGLDVSIAEKVMIAFWDDDALLSDRGSVFRPESLPRTGRLPKLSGPEGLHGQVWQFYVDMSSRMAGFDVAIAELILDERRSWKVVLDDGTRIELGRTRIDDRVRRLQQVLAMDAAIVLEKIERIDMRYPNGFAVLQVQENEDTARTYNSNMEGKNDTRVSEV